MGRKVKAMVLGDAMIPGKDFELAVKEYLSDYVEETIVGDWETDWDKLQKRRLEIEKKGPEVETVDPLIKAKGNEVEMFFGLFVPVSKEALNYMPKLRIVGVARAGVENVNLNEATERGILVFHVMGRNAEAVSDFAIGMLLAECRNIARAHYAIKNGVWRKNFSNSDWIPELKGKTVGIIGFGYVGRLVAKKLSGFDVRIIVFDPYVSKEEIEKAGCEPVDKETLFKESDFITLHARLSEDSKNLISKKDISLMKPTAYIVNTARAGLIDKEALIEALKTKRISGAALDVFWEEPIPPDSELLSLDNVTLTSHIAGTTKEALTRSPSLLIEDVRKLLKGEKPNFIINPDVLQNSEFKKWLKEVADK